MHSLYVWFLSHCHCNQDVMSLSCIVEKAFLVCRVESTRVVCCNTELDKEIYYLTTVSQACLTSTNVTVMTQCVVVNGTLVVFDSEHVNHNYTYMAQR